MEKQPLDWLRICWWAAIGLLTLFYVCALFACQTEKNLPLHNDRFPEAAAAYAAKRFPAKESRSVDTVLYSDTIYQEGPAIDTTVFCDTLFVTKQVSVRCPPSKIIRDTAIITATNWMVDGAALEDLTLKYQASVKQVDDTKQTLSKIKDRLTWWKIACIVTWAVVAVYLSFKLKKI